MYHKIVLQIQFCIFYTQNDWQEVSKLRIKKPTCCQVGFLGFLSFSVLS